MLKQSKTIHDNKFLKKPHHPYTTKVICRVLIHGPSPCVFMGIKLGFVVEENAENH